MIKGKEKEGSIMTKITMTNKDAVKLTTKTFEAIKASKTVEDLEKIHDSLKVPPKNKIKIDGYPKIDFDIQPKEIRKLQKNNLIDDECLLSNEISLKLTDPISKLLYAVAWKNGDLKKVRHVINGILDTEKNEDSQEDALVFYQFGKYLTKKLGEPIIDQHVIRAFAVYITEDQKTVEKYRTIDTLNKKHRGLISEYKNWVTSNEITQELRNEKDYAYYIDKILFAIGKTIKIPKPKKISVALKD